ncbi:MAG: tetraacyldisaccharide 4'-kinase [Gammaproteobacteria bacterium]|nr:MAG: tetraacyldisaccharide 4'-kinase [Gammaproteobacteria bacterium]
MRPERLLRAPGKRRLQAWLNRIWYGGSRWYLLLLPLSYVYGAIAGFRRALYERGILKIQTAAAPVVIIGNITAGGTGKTPLTVWLAEQLQQRGLRPGVVLRGYGADVGDAPLRVSADSDAGLVGDEALLLARRLRCPVVVHPDRLAAANAVVALGANVVLADDGLQHYGLARDFEIAVIDAARGFGNKRLLPAGPLREPIARLETVDTVAVQQGHDTGKVLRREGDPTELQFRLVPSGVHSMHSDAVRDLQDFRGQKMHAVAGIGNPERFFRMLEAHGVEIIKHALPDHAAISQDDLEFDDGLQVIMTEKDAVKCQRLDTDRCWYVAVSVEFNDARSRSLLDVLHNDLRHAIAARAS